MMRCPVINVTDSSHGQDVNGERSTIQQAAVDLERSSNWNDTVIVSKGLNDEILIVSFGFFRIFLETLFFKF